MTSDGGIACIDVAIDRRVSPTRGAGARRDPALPDARHSRSSTWGRLMHATGRLAIVICALSGIAYLLPQLRRELIKDVITWDAPKSEPAPLPAGTGPGLAPARTRVVLIDGLTADVAKTLPAWTSVCKRGVTLKVDVGFPTVSLPVEVALWTGLTQQQTGVMFRDRRPLIPPIAASIPAQVPGSIVIAEYYGWITRSIGFAIAEPAADPANREGCEPGAMEDRRGRARARGGDGRRRSRSCTILRVDAGPQRGVPRRVPQGPVEADAILALVAADPLARWFVLSMHGHVAVGSRRRGSHVRQVQSCIAGPGITPGTVGALVHVVDVARALADSTGAKLDAHARGRPYQAALATPLEKDQAVPPMALGSGAAAIFVLVAGMALVTWGVRRWWLAPWWFIVACASLFLVRGEPTLSSRMIYAPEGRDMWLAWLPSLLLAAGADGVRPAPHDDLTRHRRAAGTPLAAVAQRDHRDRACPRCSATRSRRSCRATPRGCRRSCSWSRTALRRSRLLVSPHSSGRRPIDTHRRRLGVPSPQTLRDLRMLPRCHERARVLRKIEQLGEIIGRR